MFDIKHIYFNIKQLLVAIAVEDLQAKRGNFCKVAC